MYLIIDAYDIAVIVTGDKDFIPALQKTRLKAKRVAICSMRNSCNLHLIRPEEHARDFTPLWIDDFIDDIVVPKVSIDNENDLELIEIVKQFLVESSLKTSRELGRYLSRTRMKSYEGRSLTALEYVREAHGNVSGFFSRHGTIFKIDYIEGSIEFTLDLIGDDDDDDDENDDDDDDENDDGDDEQGQLTGSSRALQDKALGKLPAVVIPEFDEQKLRKSLSKQTVAALKEKLKDLHLPVSGHSACLMLLSHKIKNQCFFHCPHYILTFITR